MVVQKHTCTQRTQLYRQTSHGTEQGFAGSDEHEKRNAMVEQVEEVGQLPCKQQTAHNRSEVLLGYQHSQRQLGDGLEHCAE